MRSAGGFRVLGLRFVVRAFGLLQQPDFYGLQSRA